MRLAVIDIDNTLWQFCDAFYEELRKINAAFPRPAQWTTWNFFEGFCSEEEFMQAVDAVHIRQDSDAFQPYPEAKGFLQSMREEGYRVVIASHRNAEMQGPTERWLNKHGLVYDDLHLSWDKTVLFSDAAVVVDDAPHTLEKAVAAKAIGAGLLFPWNRAYAGNGFGLFQNLNDVMQYIRNKNPRF